MASLLHFTDCLTGDFYNFSVKCGDIKEILAKEIAIKNTSLFSYTHVSYSCNCINYKYLYLNESLTKFLKYKQKKPLRHDGHFFTELWNVNDLTLYKKQILPEIYQFLFRQSKHTYSSFSFSTNFRVRTSDGKNCILLQQSIYYPIFQDDNSFAIINYITNITNFKNDSSIIYTVDKIDEEHIPISPTPLIKTVYFPDTINNELSSRELDIVRGIYEGLTSKEIADKLFISINTVNNHRKNILQKTNTINSHQLIRYAKNKGVL